MNVRARMVYYLFIVQGDVSETMPMYITVCLRMVVVHVKCLYSQNRKKEFITVDILSTMSYYVAIFSVLNPPNSHMSGQKTTDDLMFTRVCLSVGHRSQGLPFLPQLSAFY